MPHPCGGRDHKGRGKPRPYAVMEEGEPMTRRMTALLLTALMLALSGCGSLLDRDYRSVSRHISHTSDTEDTSALRAETYSGLVNDVQFFVSMGMEEGVVRLYRYSGDVERDLKTVCQELLTRDPLCAWALEDIQWSHSRIVSYDECVFSFSYRVDPARIPTIHNTVGTPAIRELLEAVLIQYDDSLLLQTSTYYASSDLLLNLTQEAYYAQPGSALGYPNVSVSIYPPDSSGSQHLVEIRLNYPLSRSRLLEQSQRVAAQAATMVGTSPAQGQVGYWLLYSRMAELDSYDPDGSASVYNALVDGGADSQGMALAYQYLCDQAGLTCLTVQGTLDGSPHWWNFVQAEDTWHHVDVTAGMSQEDFLFSDSTAELRYTWDAENYPECPDAEEAGSGNETAEGAQDSDLT